MFDDLTQNNIPQPSGANSFNPSEPPRPNPFKQVPQASQPQNPNTEPQLNFNPAQPKPIDDIFAQTDNPYSPTNHPQNNFKGGYPPGTMPKIKGDYGKANMVIFIIPILVVVIIALVVIAGWFVYNKFKPSVENSQNSNIQNTQNIDNNQQTSTNVNSNAENINNNPTNNIEQNNNTLPPTSTLNTNVVQPTTTAVSTTSSTVTNVRDSDSDGLSDEEEGRLGTNPLKVDSDSDGLVDFDEVKTYKSNPLSADTDGDGFKDGAEVVNGYDPIKSGAKLLK